MIKRLLLIILFAAICSSAMAQSVKVSGFEMRNDVVQIYYYADVPRGVKLTNFKVYAMINGQKRQLSNLGGDIGVIKTGGSKVITWDVFTDLDSQDISGDIAFTVECTPIGLSSSYSNARSFNMYFEYCYTPSTPLTFGMGMGGQFGGYLRVGTNARSGKDEAMMWSAGLYVLTFKWLNLNIGYNDLRIYGVSYPGYEVGATVLFGRKKWVGINGGYIGSFENSRYGEFYVGLTLNWNTGV